MQNRKPISHTEIRQAAPPAHSAGFRGYSAPLHLPDSRSTFSGPADFSTPAPDDPHRARDLDAPARPCTTGVTRADVQDLAPADRGALARRGYPVRRLSRPVRCRLERVEARGPARRVCSGGART